MPARMVVSESLYKSSKKFDPLMFGGNDSPSTSMGLLFLALLKIRGELEYDFLAGLKTGLPVSGNDDVVKWSISFPESS